MSSAPKPTTRARFAATADAKAKAPDAKHPGRPKGVEKPAGSGKRKGVPNKATVERERTLSEALIAEFKKLTPKQRQEITPMEVMRLCTMSAVEIGNWGLALLASEKWAPYVHPKLAAVVHHEGGRLGREIDGETDEDGLPGGDPGLTVRVVGGLPELVPARSGPVQEAEVVKDEDGKDVE